MFSSYWASHRFVTGRRWKLYSDWWFSRSFTNIPQPFNHIQISPVASAPSSVISEHHTSHKQHIIDRAVVFGLLGFFVFVCSMLICKRCCEICLKSRSRSKKWISWNKECWFSKYPIQYIQPLLIKKNHFLLWNYIFFSAVCFIFVVSFTNSGL